MKSSLHCKFGGIEVGRGVAAALVVLHHAGNIMAQPRFYEEHPFWGHLRYFNVGVDFFFVLSGFIIAWVHWDDIGRANRIYSYSIKRFLRIYPPYWGVLFPLMLSYLLFPSAGVPSKHDPLNMLLSIFLLPNTTEPVLGVAWTLTHEIFFYAIFSLIIVFGRLALLLLPAWALAIILAHAFGVYDFPLSFFLNPFNLEFIIGCGAAVLLRYRRIPTPYLVAATGIALFFFVHAFCRPYTG